MHDLLPINFELWLAKKKREPVMHAAIKIISDDITAMHCIIIIPPLEKPENLTAATSQLEVL